MSCMTIPMLDQSSHDICGIVPAYVLQDHHILDQSGHAVYGIVPVYVLYDHPYIRPAWLSCLWHSPGSCPIHNLLTATLLPIV